MGTDMGNLDEILEKYGQERILSPGEVLFHQGSVSDGVYYLKSGGLGVYRDEQDESYLLSVIAPGEMVGELGVTSGRSRAATVRAANKSSVIHISEAEFQRALNEVPALAAEVMRTMGNRLSNADVVRVTMGQSYRQAVQRVQALGSQKAQLEELLRLREEMTDMLVHDLLNPLGVIHNGLELMARVLSTETGPEYATTALEAMGQSVRRMRRLVHTLLDIARLEEGERMTLQRIPVDLTPLVKEMMAEEHSLAENKDIALENRLPGDLPRVLADGDVLQRVVVNLVDNALKFTPRGGQVWVEARPEAEMVQVAVVDTGPGIPSQERERVFEKFTQMPGQAGAVRGSGLGLAFCRMAVEAHGGRIWIEDGPGGRGSRFVFTLPRVQTRV